MIREQIIALDDGRFGILAEPATGQAQRPAVVLFNTGLVHRAGPFRQQVHLARKLAALGHAVLRYDMPGIGDSGMSAKTDLQVIGSVFDRLDERLGAHGYIVGGVCTAADRGWNTALAEVRARGVLLIDGIARPGKSFRAGQLNLFLKRPAKTWPGMLLRRFGSQSNGLDEEQFRDWPAAGDEPQQLQQLLDRDVRVLALYTGGIAQYFLHPGQFKETFGRAADDPRVEFEFWPDCDHLIMSRRDRERVHERIGRWCNSVKPL